MHAFRRRVSPSLVISCLALAIALGGTSYAAVVLPANSVGATQLRANAVDRAEGEGRLPAGRRSACRRACEEDRRPHVSRRRRPRHQQLRGAGGLRARRGRGSAAAPPSRAAPGTRFGRATRSGARSPSTPRPRTARRRPAGASRSPAAQVATPPSSTPSASGRDPAGRGLSAPVAAAAGRWEQRSPGSPAGPLRGVGRVPHAGAPVPARSARMRTTEPGADAVRRRDRERVADAVREPGDQDGGARAGRRLPARRRGHRVRRDRRAAVGGRRREADGRPARCPASPTTPVGAPGTVARRRPRLDGADAGPLPAAFVAVTVNV